MSLDLFCILTGYVADDTFGRPDFSDIVSQCCEIKLNLCMGFMQLLSELTICML